ncbi:uncharacterized protein ACNS7B_004829 isoform 2-T2 [Menidia menidia]
MDSGLTFIILLGPGTHLHVGIGQDTAECDEDDALHPHQNKTRGSLTSPTGPSVQILSSAWLSEDPEAPRFLVCIVDGLKSPEQRVLWWVDDTLLTSAGGQGQWTASEGGYSTTSVWEVSAEDWEATSIYWCGTVQDGREYREKLCSED